MENIKLKSKVQTTIKVTDEKDKNGLIKLEGIQKEEPVKKTGNLIGA